jgi:acyl-CoA reductase-like NAD-dependent aldehyde dehydrogenase
VTAVLETIEIIRPSGVHRSHDREVIDDITGAPVADLGLAPTLLVNRVLAELRAAPDQADTERLAAIAKAASLFATAELEGEGPEEYQAAVARVGGLPRATVRDGVGAIVEVSSGIDKYLHQQRPEGAALTWRDQSTVGGSAVWTRRGRVFAVHAPGNHPGPHAEWLVALGLGYRVVVRPSRRDPYTPRRLMRALLAAGVDPGYLAMLPCSYAVAGSILRGADLAMVYGDDNVVRQYADDSRVLVRGPGRSKIVVTADTDWRDHLDVLADSVAGGGGTACVNTTSIFVEGDARGLAEALAARLDALPSRPLGADDAALPVYPAEQARALEGYVGQRAEGAVALHDGPLLVDWEDGGATLRPAVFLVDDADAPQARSELPFPCVWVAPWDRARGAASLRDTLVLTVLGGDDELIDDCVNEPSIRNVYQGRYPTYWMKTGMPHDGYLGEFLMGVKSVAR